MTVFVMGAHGFLGSALTNYFTRAGERPLSISFRPDRRNTFHLEFASILCSEKPRCVINAGAAQTGKDDPAALADLIDSNVYLPAAVSSLILKHSPETVFINFGSSWQIGEDGEFSPFNAYASSKAAAERFLDHFALAGLRVASLRLYDTYGPGDSRNKIVNLIADALITKRELPMSPGGQMIDLVHIDDVVSAVLTTWTILEKEATGVHHIFAIRSGKPVTITDVLALLKMAAGFENADFIKPGVYPYRDRERFVLFENTPTPPGWTPNVGLFEGLKTVLEMRRIK